MQALAEVSSPSKLWFTCLSRFEDSCLVYDVNSMVDLRRVVDFQLVQLFSWCGDESNDFQALHRLDWELEMIPITWNNLNSPLSLQLIKV